jgi:DNA-directed RNA polymerase subunit RPC12/RpoP
MLPIRICVACGERFELTPGKPGFANRCPACSPAKIPFPPAAIEYEKCWECGAKVNKKTLVTCWRCGQFRLCGANTDCTMEVHLPWCREHMPLAGERKTFRRSQKCWECGNKVPKETLVTCWRCGRFKLCGAADTGCTMEDHLPWCEEHMDAK